MHQAARDLEAALHPAREGAHETPAAVRQLHHLEHLVQAPPDLRPRHAVELGVEAEVLLRGEVVVERGVLEDEPDPPAAAAIRVARPRSPRRIHSRARATRPPSRGNAGIRLKPRISALIRTW